MNDFDRLAQELDAKADLVDEAATKAAQQAMGDVRSRAQEGSPTDSGSFASRWEVRMLPDGAEVGNDDPAGPSLEFGAYKSTDRNRTDRKPPQPTLRPAVAAIQPGQRVVEAVIEVLDL